MRYSIIDFEFYLTQEGAFNLFCFSCVIPSIFVLSFEENNFDRTNNFDCSVESSVTLCWY